MRWRATLQFSSMVAAWIFVLSPPRERPKAWSPPFFLVLLPRAGGLVPLWSPSTDDGLGPSIRTEGTGKAAAILPALPSVEIACKLHASSPTPVVIPPRAAHTIQIPDSFQKIAITQFGRGSARECLASANAALSCSQTRSLIIRRGCSLSIPSINQLDTAMVTLFCGSAFDFIFLSSPWHSPWLP